MGSIPKSNRGGAVPARIYRAFGTGGKSANLEPKRLASRRRGTRRARLPARRTNGRPPLLTLRRLMTFSSGDCQGCARRLFRLARRQLVMYVA